MTDQPCAVSSPCRYSWVRRNSVKITAFPGQPQARATVKARSSPRRRASPLAFTRMARAARAQSRSSASSAWSSRRSEAGRRAGTASGSSHSSDSSAKAARSDRSAGPGAAPPRDCSSESASRSSVLASAKEEEARIFR